MSQFPSCFCRALGSAPLCGATPLPLGEGVRQLADGVRPVHSPSPCERAPRPLIVFPLKQGRIFVLVCHLIQQSNYQPVT
jgi:hypothetical protein